MGRISRLRPRVRIVLEGTNKAKWWAALFIAVCLLVIAFFLSEAIAVSAATPTPRAYLPDIGGKERRPNPLIPGATPTFKPTSTPEPPPIPTQTQEPPPYGTCWICEWGPCPVPPTPQPVPDDFVLRGKGVPYPKFRSTVDMMGASWEFGASTNNKDWEEINNIAKVRDPAQWAALQAGTVILETDGKVILWYTEPDVCPHQACISLDAAIQDWHAFQQMFPKSDGWIKGSA